MRNQVIVIYLLIILVSTRVSSQVTPRYGQTAALVGSNIYIIGGVRDRNNRTPLNEILMLDLGKPLNNNSLPWQNIAAIGALQTAWGTACAVRDKIYLFGGRALVDGTQSVSSIFKSEFKKRIGTKFSFIV